MENETEATAMIQPRMHPALASQHYRSLELASRTSEASPYALVGLLYEELLNSLDANIATAASDGVLPGNAHVVRARSILATLERSLDFEKGGMLAPAVARIYRATGTELAAGVACGDCGKLRELRGAISTLTYAWTSLSAV